MKSSNNNNKGKMPYFKRSTTTTTESTITRTGKDRKPNFKKDAHDSRASKVRDGANDKKSWLIKAHDKSIALPSVGKAVNANDESWYIGKLRDQAERFASVPWTAINGEMLPEDAASYNYVGPEGNTTVNTLTRKSRTFPSIMVAGLIPALGNTNINPSRLDMPWMTTAEQKVAYLQSKISGSLPFSSADLVAYWFCCADVFAEIAQAERALKIARTWKTFENVSYPRQLAAALGWDFDSIMGNVLIFEGQIQEIINLANTLLLPKDLAIVERWYFLYSHVFKDSNLPTAKLYGYRKDAYYTFEEQYVETGTSCRFHEAPCMEPSTEASGYWTPQTWFNNMMTTINKLLPGRSTAVVDIMAKLLRAYDVSTFFAYPNVSTGGIEAIFDPEALTAFANMNITGVVAANRVAQSMTNFDIVQNPDYLTMTYRSNLWRPGVSIPTNTLLRAWEAKPSVGSFMEMTRLTVCADTYPDLNSNDPTVYYWMYTGTEIVTRISIYTGSGEVITTRAPKVNMWMQYVFGVNYEMVMDNVSDILLWSRFEYAPILLLERDMSAELGYSDLEMDLVADLDNYTSVSASVLGRVHRLAIANLWGVQTDFIG